MNSREYNSTVKLLRAENLKHTDEFVSVPPDHWPKTNGQLVLDVKRNARFLVQIIQFSKGIIRLSICRTMIDRNGAWLDGITWEELQSIKDAVGFADRDAVEVFPRSCDIVNVANMRHLWVMDKELPCVWRGAKKGGS